MRTFTCVLHALVVFASLNAAYASPKIGGHLNWTQLDSGRPEGQQGWSVDISGDLAIVGDTGFPGGGAYIYDLTSGDLIHNLHPSDAGPNDLFGFSVAIDGDLAIVASGQNNAAYVFDTTTGQQLHKLTPSANINGSIRSVDISDGIAVLGATVTFDYGAAFLYDALSGTQTRQIDGPRTFNKRGFGSDVAIEGGMVAVTSPGSGRDDIHVYDSQTGSLLWRYGYSTTSEQSFFRDVVIDGDLLVASGGVGLPSNAPSAYVFDLATGDFLREIDIDMESDNYSTQIDLSGDRLVIGAPGTFVEGAGYFTGAVNVFDVNTGVLIGTIPNPEPRNVNFFGSAIAIENDRLIVGTPSDDLGRGRVYSYSLVPEPNAIAILCVGSVCFALRRRS